MSTSTKPPRALFADPIFEEITEVKERGSDDDHFYGPWTKGGGRAPASQKMPKQRTEYTVEGWKGMDAVGFRRTPRIKTVRTESDHYIADLGADRVLVRQNDGINSKLIAERDETMRWMRVKPSKLADSLIEDEEMLPEDIVEAASDDDHFYGAWSKGGGRGGPTSVAELRKLHKSPVDGLNVTHGPLTDFGLKHSDGTPLHEGPMARSEKQEYAEHAALEAWWKKHPIEPDLYAKGNELEYDARRIYTGDGYHHVNDYLHGRSADVDIVTGDWKVNGALESRKASEVVKTLQAHIDHQPPLDKPVTVFRGMKSEFNDWDVGETYQDKSFTSTSLSRIVAEGSFADSDGGHSMVVRIDVPVGTKAMWLGSREKELLFAPGTKFKIKEIGMYERSGYFQQYGKIVSQPYAILDVVP